MQIDPDATIRAHNGIAPRIHETAFIAAGARIIGDVEIGPQASIWYNCVLRGDLNRIVIGARSNIQDGTMIHVEDGSPGLPTLIGEDVLIGHMAILHGCIVEDRAFVGMGSIIMDACRIASQGMLAAGALLTPGKAIASGELWAGRPAVFRRGLSQEELASSEGGVRKYLALAESHQGVGGALGTPITDAAAGSRPAV
jgi:carbonic anhydrase/acetyltransferase-like protein (isoleucine patch superfamily)